MNVLTSLIFVAGILYSDCKIEGGWKGIKVFETSRQDVERVLGKPIEENSALVRYESDEALFIFYFSGEPCSDPERLTGSFTVKKGIVVDYRVTPKKPLRLEDLDWDRDRYVRTQNSHQHQIVNYRNDDAGVIFDTTKMDDGKNEVLRTIHFVRPKPLAPRFACKSDGLTR